MKNLIGMFLIAAAIGGVGGYFTFTYTQAVTNEARYQCAISSRYTTTDESGSEVWYPVEELYKKCLAEKGL